ncbi:metalloendoproteinase 3-MMP [Nicotiana tomentosiformis]|uniref:metalloendoproteinase 3-MMP n=1 Tax=Nicotiana tomentosiformis TaxID=4098 RepID=UPI00051B8A18|nr:metalloendoproteinase 3-MMP-like [Nicotiana tomentosiformis]
MRIPFFSFFAVAVIIFNASSPVSARFYRNISSIPRFIIPNNSAWNHFNKYLGCHVGQKVEGLAKIKQYFQHFGYINSLSKNFSDEFDDVLFSAVKTYQLNFNLNTTGEFDAVTLQHMIKPRCGNPDIVNGTTSMNSGNSPANSPAMHTMAHFSFFEGRPRWPPSKTNLNYAFLPENQLTDSVKAAFGRAFDKWSEVTPLSFTETGSYRTADIRIGFLVGDHGDGNPFDGPMKILAHAFSPPTGFFHLDGEENWVVDGGFLKEPVLEISGVDLESVAVHEIGHLLGLDHSSKKEAIMFPTLGAGVRKVELSSDDIKGVHMLYGSNPNNNGSSTVFTPSQENDISGASTFGSLVFVDYWILLGIALNFGVILF